jgi:hypothetical protein
MNDAGVPSKLVLNSLPFVKEGLHRLSGVDHGRAHFSRIAQLPLLDPDYELVQTVNGACVVGLHFSQDFLGTSVEIG